MSRFDDFLKENNVSDEEKEKLLAHLNETRYKKKSNKTILTVGISTAILVLVLAVMIGLNVNKNSGTPVNHNSPDGLLASVPDEIKKSASELTNEDKKVIQDYQISRFKKIMDKYGEDWTLNDINDKGDALHDGYELAKELADEYDYIESVDPLPTSVRIKYKDGGYYYFIPQDGETCSGGTEFAVWSIDLCYEDDASKEVKKSEPHLSKQADDATDGSARNIANRYEKYIFDDIFNIDDDISLDDIKDEFGRNQVILWYGHGNYDPERGCGLYFPQTIEWGELIDAGDGYSYYNDYKIILYPDEIDSILPANMDGTFVYLGNCSSLRDNRLARVFEDAGCSAIIGNTRVISRDYNTKMMREVVNGLVDGRSLEESLTLAKSIHGERDFEAFENDYFDDDGKATTKKEFSEVNIFMGNDYMLEENSSVTDLGEVYVNTDRDFANWNGDRSNIPKSFQERLEDELDFVNKSDGGEEDYLCYDKMREDDASNVVCEYYGLDAGYVNMLAYNERFTIFGLRVTDDFDEDEVTEKMREAGFDYVGEGRNANEREYRKVIPGDEYGYYTVLIGLLNDQINYIYIAYENPMAG